MASITLKNVPDDLLHALRDAAEADRRSLNQEVIHFLISAVSRRVGRATPQPLGLEAQLAAWRKLAGKWESDVDPTTEAEQLRERHLPAREVDL